MIKVHGQVLKLSNMKQASRRLRKMACYHCISLSDSLAMNFLAQSIPLFRAHLQFLYDPKIL